MALLSNSSSINRYRVAGKIDGPVMDTISAKLEQFAIGEIDESVEEKAVGWTSFETPYQHGFKDASFVYGTYFVFSLRIDKKTIPNGTLKKYVEQETARKLAESGRSYLSRDEKKMLKENVLHMLSARVPANPTIHNVMWDYEKDVLYFFSNQKKANEELETLFLQTFNISLIRIIPYTMAYFSDRLADPAKDALAHLSPTCFVA